MRHWAGGEPIDLGYRAAYSALSKPAWGLALAWIIIVRAWRLDRVIPHITFQSCYYGYGGPINSFMSWSIWIPLGRLSYSSYLIHLMIVIYCSGLQQAGFLYSSLLQMVIQYITCDYHQLPSDRIVHGARGRHHVFHCDILGQWTGILLWPCRLILFLGIADIWLLRWRTSSSRAS